MASPDLAMSQNRTVNLFVAIRELWRDRRRWVLAGLVVSAAVAIYATTGAPQWTATTQALVDTNPSLVGAALGQVIPLQDHAGLFANVLLSQEGIDEVARASGIQPDRIAVASGDQSVPRSYSRAPASAAPYSLKLEPWDLSPEILITAKAATRERAIAIANGAVRGLTLYLYSAQRAGGSGLVDAIRQLGPPFPSSAGGGRSPVKLALVFVIALVGWCALLRTVDRSLLSWRTQAGRPWSQPAPPQPRPSALSSPVADPVRRRLLRIDE